MNRSPLAGFRTIRLYPWVARLTNAWFPWRFSWKNSLPRARIAGLWAGDLWIFRSSREKIRSKRRSITMDVEELRERAAPTAIMAVDPATASLVSFAALHETLPPVVQNVEHPSQHPSTLKPETAVSSPGALFFWARSNSVIGNDGATSTQSGTVSSSLAPGGRGVGGEGASVGSPATFLSTISGADIAPNLEALPNGQTPFVDPLADFVPLKNKPILSSGGDSGALSARVTGSDGGGSIGGSGSAASGANASQSGYSDPLPSSSPFGSSLSLPPGALTANTIPVANTPGSPITAPTTGTLPPDFRPLTSGTGNPNPEHKKKADPLWVLDASKAIVVTPGTTENEFSNTAMDLRMQVSGATVSSYSWDLTNAPDTTGVSGSSTYDLTFSWSSWTTGNKTETIVAKETPQGGSQVTQTLTFLVAGTNSPAWSTPPTTASIWPNVLPPDALTVMQGSQDAGYGNLGLMAGDLGLSHNLPSYNPGVQGLALQYDSLAANTLPIFITHFKIDPTQAVPPTVDAQLTLNGVAGTTVWYNTANLNPGDIMQIPLQGDATGLSTGRYSYSISVTANYGTPVTTTYSGSVDIVNSSASPFGAGWSLSVLERIWPVTGGVILELPGGLSLWWTTGTNGSFNPPAGETSTLSLANNVYTRTLKDGTKINFNSSGYQTSIVDTNNNSLTFGWNGSNQLTSLTDFNNLVTTLAYSAAGKVTSITDPATRITSLSYDTGNTKLTAVTDPDSALWGFGYDSANRLTTLTDPLSHVTSYAYGTGRVTTVTRADNSTLLLTALELQGIPASGTGTQSNPATPVLAAQATAAFTDARSNVWNTRMDWLGFGEPTQAADPLGDLSNIYRDQNGFPWLVANPLGQRTRNFFDTLENVTEAVNTDDTHHQATFNSFSEPLTQTDELNNVTSYAYDTHGNNTTTTDALSHTTTMTYDSHGFHLTTTDPLSHTTTLAYDSRERQTSTTDPLNHTATMAYDSASVSVR